MQFYSDPQLQGIDIQRLNGRYVKSFESDNAQLRADLYQRGDKLVAVISYAPGFNALNITDRWISLLRPEAERLGFDTERFFLVYPATAVPMLESASGHG